MKSPDALLIPVVTAAVLAISLAGCGQTGPLYMPKPPGKPAAQTPAPATPAPATTTPVAPSNDLPTPVQ